MYNVAFEGRKSTVERRFSTIVVYLENCHFKIETTDCQHKNVWTIAHDYLANELTGERTLWLVALTNNIDHHKSQINNHISTLTNEVTKCLER